MFRFCRFIWFGFLSITFLVSSCNILSLLVVSERTFPWSFRFILKILKIFYYVNLVLLPRLLVVHRDAFVFTPLLTCLVQMAVKFSVQCKQRTYLVALNLWHSFSTRLSDWRSFWIKDNKYLWYNKKREKSLNRVKRCTVQDELDKNITTWGGVKRTAKTFSGEDPRSTPKVPR